MRYSVYVPLVVCVLVAAGAPKMARRWRPIWAVRTLSLSAVLLSVAYVWGLVLLAGILVGQAAPVAERGGYSQSLLGRLDPVPEAASVAAIAGLVVAAWRLAVWVRAAWKKSRILARLFAAGQPLAGELQVLPDEEPFAAAIPAGIRRSGRIVVSAGMLKSLDPAERRVLLAHERSHIGRRHHRHQAIGQLTAALNPMLVGLRRGIDFGLERWADEDAVAAVGDRDLVARAVSRAALATADYEAPSAIASAGLGFERLGVADRVDALSVEPGKVRRMPALAAAVVTAAALLASSDATIGFAHVLVGAGAH